MHRWAVMAAATTVMGAVRTVIRAMRAARAVMGAAAPIYIGGRAFDNQRRAAVVGRAAIAIAITAGGIGRIRIAVIHSIRWGYNTACQQGSACYGAGQGA